MKQYGYIKSNLLGDELQVDEMLPEIKLPKRYSVYLGTVRDQGPSPKCVSVSLTDMVKWHLMMEGKKIKFSDSIFYDLDPEATKIGMSPKNAFEILMAKSKEITKKSFDTYGIINSLEVAKRAMLLFGPIMVGMKVKSQGDVFWKGSANYGGHAVLFTGFDEQGFTIRNSWGYQYGDRGYIQFPYSDFELIQESWALIK